MALNRHPPRLRPRPYSLVEPLGFLRLHLDDIDSLLTILRGSANDVVLATQNASADNAEDLKDCTSEELATVAIRTKQPDITVWLGRKKCAVETMEDSKEAVALVGDAARFLRQRPKPFGSVFVPMLAKSSIALVAFVTFFIVVGLLVSFSDLTLVYIIILVIAVATALLAISNWRAAQRAGGAWIVPARRSEARGLSASTRVALISSTVSAVAGAIVGSLLTYLLTK